MKTLILLFVCISIHCICFAQDAAKNPNQSISKNTIFGEFMGNSLVYGINYDRILVNKEKWKFTGRVGFGYLYVRQDKYSIFYLPTEFSFLIGRTKHFFETGLGVSNYVETIPKAYNSNAQVKHYGYLFSRFGYRFQRPHGGFFFKGGINPMLALTKSARYTFYYSEFFGVWGGVGIGYTFKQKKNK